MEWLSELYTRIEEQKLKQERTIQSLRQLFKPWPLIEPEATNKIKQNVPIDGQPHDAPGNKTTPELTSAEKESLLLVDKVLSKAQKARNVQKKLEESTKSHFKGGSHADTKHKTSSAIGNKKNGEISGCEPKEDSPRQDKMGITEDNEKAGKVAPTKSTQKNTSNSSNSKIGLTKLKTEVTKKPSSSASAEDTTERSRISERPGSSSGHKKVVPVHVSAPFKTNPNLGNSRLQTTYRAATAKTFAKPRGAISSGKGSGRRGSSKVTSSASFSKSESRNLPRTNKPVINDLAEGSISNGKNIHDSNLCDKLSVSSVKESNDTEEVQNRISEMSVKHCEADSNVQSKDVNVDQVSSEKKGFDLTKDGASLTVPGKLKKLLHYNQKLRQKLNTQKLTRKVDSPQTNDDFPVRFEHVFGNEEEQYTQAEARKARHILHTYTNLSSLLDSLNLEKMSEDNHPADVYRCKKMMEYILVTYQETEDLLHNIDFGKLSSIATFNGNNEPRMPLSQSDSTYLWYTRLTPQGHAPQYGYKYTSYKHLEKYLHTVHQIQLTQLQIDVIDTVARLLIPLLKSLDPGSSEFIQVLRAGYSLLSIHHHCMPVVVKDTIPDESVHELVEGEI